MNLYPFQIELINKIRSALVDGYRSPVIVSPTGSGKTIMFSEIAKGAMQKNNRVLILVHKHEILTQTMKKLYSFGVQCGQIAAGKPNTRDYIQCAMVLTLNNRLDIIRKPDLIIVDEGHHFLKSNTFGNVLQKYNDVPKLFFTATPERLSGEGMGINSHGFCDTMIMGPSINKLVNDGYLAYPVLYRPEKEIADKLKIKKGDYDTDQQEAIMSRKAIIGDVIQHYKRYLNGAPAVCFCVSINHAKIMADQFNSAGFSAMAVYGGMNQSERDMAFRGLNNGSIQILTNCSLIDEGVDVPNLGGVILLRKTLSLAKYLQMAGRALRVSPGKTHAVILDHASNYHIHGHVIADREWSLDAGKRNNRKIKPPTTTSCPKCFAVWPGTPRTCPECGFSFADNESVAAQQRKTPEQIAGELVAALPEGADPAQIKSLAGFVQRLQTFDARTRQRAMIAKAAELQRGEIDALAKEVGYKPGWTHFVWTKVLKNRA